MDLVDVPYLTYHISWPLCYYQSSHKAKDFILPNYSIHQTWIFLLRLCKFIYLFIYSLINLFIVLLRWNIDEVLNVCISHSFLLLVIIIVVHSVLERISNYSNGEAILLTGHKVMSRHLLFILSTFLKGCIYLKKILFASLIDVLLKKNVNVRTFTTSV